MTTRYILNVIFLKFFSLIKTKQLLYYFNVPSVTTIRHIINTLCRSWWTRKPRQPRNRTVNDESYRSTKRSRLRIARRIKRRARRENRRDDKWSRSEDEQCVPMRRIPIIPLRSLLLKRNDESLHIESELEQAIRSLGIAPPRGY